MSPRLLLLPLFFASFLFSCGDDEAEPKRLTSGGYLLEVSGDGRAIDLYQETGRRLLLRLPADAIQVGTVGELDETSSYDPYWLEYEDALFKPDPPRDLRFLTVQSATVREDSGRLLIDAVFNEGTSAVIELGSGAGGAFTLKILPQSNIAIAYLRIRARASADEGFYGLGEWPDAVNHRGKLRPMQLEPELSLESANNEAHVPVPLLIGTNGYGVFVESKRFGLFDVARKEPDLIEITYGTAEESAAGLLVHLFGAQPIDVTRKYYEVTGDPLLPAEWAYGPWIWRDENEDQAEVEADIAKIRELDLATSAIWIDRPYATAVNTFDFAAAKFPDPMAMIQRAHDAGLRVALWHTPYLEESAQPLLSEAIARGFYPPRVGLRLNGWGDLIDLTNPEAFEWWQSNIERYTSMGIEGFKLDYGEDVISGLGNARTPWEFHDGSTELTGHYEYTKLYHRAYAEMLPSSGGFLLCRTGRWGDQKNVSVIWPGDLDATLTKHREMVDGKIGVGGLPASVIMSLSLGPSGFPFYGSDTGGYRHSPPDKETFIRWFQQTAFSTVMQVGDSSSQPPWEFTAENGRDQATLDLYRDFARTHLRLFPYVWSYAQRLKEDGRAIMRPLGLVESGVGHPDDVYLLGDHLLVAPVVEQGARTRAIPFPRKRWYNFFDGTMIEGEQTVEVDAPLEKIPVFVREGGIVPMLRETIDTLATTTSTAVESYANDAGVLHLRIAPGNGRFDLYDGTGIVSEATAEGQKVTISPGAKFLAGYVIELLGGETKTLAPGETSAVLR